MNLGVVLTLHGDALLLQRICRMMLVSAMNNYQQPDLSWCLVFEQEDKPVKQELVESEGMQGKLVILGAIQSTGEAAQ